MSKRATENRAYNWVTMANGTDYSTQTFTSTTTDSLGNVITTEATYGIQGVYCAVAGNAVLRNADGTDVDFVGLLAGVTYPFCPSIKVSGTATLIALYSK